MLLFPNNRKTSKFSKSILAAATQTFWIGTWNEAWEGLKTNFGHLLKFLKLRVRTWPCDLLWPKKRTCQTWHKQELEDHLHTEAYLVCLLDSRNMWPICPVAQPTPYQVGEVIWDPWPPSQSASSLWPHQSPDERTAQLSAAQIAKPLNLKIINVY